VSSEWRKYKVNKDHSTKETVRLSENTPNPIFAAKLGIKFNQLMYPRNIDFMNPMLGLNSKHLHASTKISSNNCMKSKFFYRQIL
jgi:hypothetical protein